MSEASRIPSLHFTSLHFGEREVRIGDGQFCRIGNNLLEQHVTIIFSSSKE
jgi:hypothetical protein